jgi:uncharacterized cupin superfamily protein
MEVAVLTLEPAQVHEGTPGGAGSRGQVYVVRGTLLAGPVERVTELAPGDYASFPTDVPHTFEARRHPVRALVLTESRR